MNKKGSGVVTFISVLFIFVSFISLTAYLYPMVLANKEFIKCAESYVVECFLLDFSLPIIAISLLSFLIGYVSRRVKR